MENLRIPTDEIEVSDDEDVVEESRGSPRLSLTEGGRSGSVGMALPQILD